MNKVVLQPIAPSFYSCLSSHHFSPSCRDESCLFSFGWVWIFVQFQCRIEELGLIPSYPNEPGARLFCTCCMNSEICSWKAH
jgi:hypothetical protein